MTLSLLEVSPRCLCPVAPSLALSWEDKRLLHSFFWGGYFLKVVPCVGVKVGAVPGEWFVPAAKPQLLLPARSSGVVSLPSVTSLFPWSVLGSWEGQGTLKITGKALHGFSEGEEGGWGRETPW